MSKLSKYDESFLQSWGEKRKAGRWMYGLKEGAFAGLFNGIFVLVILTLFDKKSFATEVFSLKGLAWVVFFVVSTIIAYATIMWWVNERSYRKKMNRQ